MHMSRAKTKTMGSTCSASSERKTQLHLQSSASCAAAINLPSFHHGLRASVQKASCRNSSSHTLSGGLCTQYCLSVYFRPLVLECVASSLRSLSASSFCSCRCTRWKLGPKPGTPRPPSQLGTRSPAARKQKQQQEQHYDQTQQW